MAVWTCENFLQYSKEIRKKFREDFPTSSKPKKLFKPLNGMKNDYDEYIFSLNNWNDTDILRFYIENNFEDKGKTYEQWNEENMDVFIFFTSKEDIKHATIILKFQYEHTTYDISWYKHRGNTSNITKNGMKIYLPEYIELLNILKIERHK